MTIKTCQYGGCIEAIGGAGVTVTLRTATFDSEKQAKFCCASHAASALQRLAMDRSELVVPLPQRWKVA